MGIIRKSFPFINKGHRKASLSDFSNLFNAYTKSFNKRYERYGPLFVNPFKRIEIKSNKYFKNLILYILIFVNVCKIIPARRMVW